ncbi:signal peptidase II [bacterium]|nr:signal peptidase II [candidate division CSSED10-310 bacterium]
MCERNSKHVPLKTLGAILFLAVLDQATKAVATICLNPSRPIEVIPGVFHLALVHNRGAAFGVLRDLPDPWRLVLFSIISILAFVVLGHMLVTRPSHSRMIPVSIALIGGGALGNFIDRFRYGHVIDFIDTYPLGYHFPTFNIADSCITIGVTLMIVHLLFFEARARDAS